MLPPGCESLLLVLAALVSALRCRRRSRTAEDKLKVRPEPEVAYLGRFLCVRNCSWSFTNIYVIYKKDNSNCRLDHTLIYLGYHDGVRIITGADPGGGGVITSPFHTLLGLGYKRPYVFPHYPNIGRYPKHTHAEVPNPEMPLSMWVAAIILYFELTLFGIHGSFTITQQKCFPKCIVKHELLLLGIEVNVSMHSHLNAKYWQLATEGHGKDQRWYSTIPDFVI